ncbi:MAG: hypothetical protein O2944_06315 [Proteobacteria bacterium]|nr:hypothetical protein [Pseudomonadota bacterium]
MDQTGLQLPRVLVVTQNPQHKETLDKILRPFFSIDIFSDVDEAMENSVKSGASVIIVDQNGRRDKNSASFIEHS